MSVGFHPSKAELATLAIGSTCYVQEMDARGLYTFYLGEVVEDSDSTWMVAMPLINRVFLKHSGVHIDIRERLYLRAGTPEVVEWVGKQISATRYRNNLRDVSEFNFRDLSPGAIEKVLQIIGEDII